MPGDDCEDIERPRVRAADVAGEVASLSMFVNLLVMWLWIAGLVIIVGALRAG